MDHQINVKHIRELWIGDADSFLGQALLLRWWCRREGSRFRLWRTFVASIKVDSREPARPRTYVSH